MHPANGNGLICGEERPDSGLDTARLFFRIARSKPCLAIVQDYDHHKEIYKPQIADSKAGVAPGR